MKDSLGDHPVATIHATTELQDKPSDTSKDLSTAVIESVDAVVYVDNKNYETNLQVKLNNTIVDPANYHLTITPIMQPTQDRAGILNVAIVGKNTYTGYQAKQIPIKKAAYKEIAGSNITFDRDTQTINITAHDSYTHPLNNFNQIALPLQLMMLQEL